MAQMETEVGVNLNLVISVVDAAHWSFFNIHLIVLPSAIGIVRASAGLLSFQNPHGVLVDSGRPESPDKCDQKI